MAIAFSDGGSPWRRWLGIAMIIVAAAISAMLIGQLRRPRIAFRDGHVLFYLRCARPISVPAGIVEAFFLGQGPVQLPGGIHTQQHAVNLVARLSQRQTEWAFVEVKPVLGRWSDSYVTIRGAWCEPLNSELIRRLNRRLKEVKTPSDEKI